MGQSPGGLSDGSTLPQMLLEARQKTLGVADNPSGVCEGQRGSLQVVVLLFAGLACPAVNLAEFRFEFCLA